ncbi:MAG: N-acyl amino acid synthase FeeM domain-containing protein [Thiobacillus sp.]
MLSGFKKHRQEPDEWDKTIVAISPYQLTDLVLPENQNTSNQPDENTEQHIFKIRLAHSNERVNSASMLVQRKYASRGYEASGFQKDPERITLMAFQEDKVIGTLTLGLDSPNPLLVEDLYKTEIDGLREHGHKVCELTKLAVDQIHGSKRILASLFHIAYIYGRVLQGHSDVVIEVNPRHVAFYKRMLGFNQLGPERMCSRVNAPAVLLRLELDYVDQQIALLGGKSDAASGVRSLYPYFFNKSDEIGITHRLTNGE